MDDFKKYFEEYYISVLKKYSVFTGRSRRKEYWMFVLFHFIICTIVSILSSIRGIGIIFYILLLVYCIAVILPAIAVGIRRLHDTDRSGWWLLICLVPIIGAIILIVFTVQEGTKGDNQYGPDPKA